MKLYDIKTLSDLTRYAQVIEAEGSAGLAVDEELTRDLLLEDEIGTCSYHLARNSNNLKHYAEDCRKLVARDTPRLEEFANEPKKHWAAQYKILDDFRGYTGENIEKIRAKVKRYQGSMRRLHKEYAREHYKIIQNRRAEFEEYYAAFKATKAACAAAVAQKDWLTASKLVHAFEPCRYPKFHSNTNKSFVPILTGYGETADWHDHMRNKVIPEEYWAQGRGALAEDRAAAALPEVLAVLQEIARRVQDPAASARTRYSRATEASNLNLKLREFLHVYRQNLEIVAGEESRRARTDDNQAARA